MTKIHPAYFAAIGLAIAGVWLLVQLVVQKKKNACLAEQLAQQTTMVAETSRQLAGLQERYDQIMAFQNSLKTAELTTLLQKPRLEAQGFGSGHNFSDKYRIIRVLAEKGLSIDEIASMLVISTHEARQLVTLSRLSQENSPANSRS